MLIEKAAVIGAGTMGAGIACQLANAGVPCLLLDIVPNGLSDAERADPRARSKLATDAIARGTKNKPFAFMDAASAALVEPGNIEDDIARVAECDWVIEAVTENLDIKRDLYTKIAEHRRDDTVVSSNTSGLSLSLLTDGFDESFRKHFLITHFFNPPRYMYLLELVRGPDTDPKIFEGIREFSEIHLGKGVVECKDTPNFIANRIGVYAMGASCRHMLEVGLSIEEVDAISGPALGRPKTAAFRLHDLVGIDVAVMVMDNVKKLIPNDPDLASIETPEFLVRMKEKGLLGRKAGAGFYKKVGKDLLVLDLETFEYREQRPVEFASLAAAKKGADVGDRVRKLIGGDDKAADFAWRNVADVLLYSARLIPEIADDLVSVDRAIRWGFSWELGPFELWDAIGVPYAVERMRAEGREIPPVVEALLASGAESFYGARGDGADREATVFDPAASNPVALDARPGVLSLDVVRLRSKPVIENDAAAAWDIGDGVLCVEFRSKMNSISDDTLRLLRDTVELAERDDWAGVVVGNQAANFSVGANLVGLSGAAAEQKWDLIETMIRAFHTTAMRLRYSRVPVVAAVQGMCLGGGCEVPLACDAIQASAETYMGLVELGVGLIPAGGGTREMACRASESVAGAQADLFPFLQRAFESIGQAKVSTSAEEARALGFLLDVDRISMNKDRAIADAKRRVLTLAEEGYRPPKPRTAVTVAGAPGLAELEVGLHQFHQAGYISDYDRFLGGQLAYVLCGGKIDREFTVSEQYLLDLECEVFLRLCGQEKTHQRIAHTLKTGKPLRN